MYATIQRARAAGAIGTDTEVADALAVARSLIDSYTGQWWEPTPATIAARVGSDGYAQLPYVVQSVDSVQSVGGTSYPASGFIVTSSEVIGQLDGVQLGGTSWADPLVVGAEPWNGGWSNLQRGSLGDRVLVVGTFGYAVTPPQVEDAAAALAAWRTAGGSILASSTGDATPPRTDDEGNSVSITVDATAPVPTTPTTGLEAVDVALRPLVRRHVRIS